MEKVFYKKSEEIELWLNKHGIFYDYEIVPDKKYGFVVNLNTDFNVFNKNLTFIPVKFNIVNGVFNCSQNQLESLEFAPIYVGKSFYCNYNNLKSLEGCPKRVNGDFYCDNNDLKNLEYCPTTVNFLKFDKKILDDLSFIPERVKTGRVIIMDDNIIEEYEFETLKQIHNNISKKNNNKIK